MLEKASVAARLPAQDLERARAFYAEKLGLEPHEERPGGLLYRCARGEFALFESGAAPSGSHTQMAWEVDDIEVGGRRAQVPRRGIRGVRPACAQDDRRRRRDPRQLSEQGRRRASRLVQGQ
jgi:catechol 2,3-dioxygenase-like lactoylglutathione lyase family enzyme